VTVDVAEATWRLASVVPGPLNNRMNLTVRPVTRLACLLLARDSHGRAQGARPSRPAGYAGRSADFRRQA
jgi:hypothetical protein